MRTNPETKSEYAMVCMALLLAAFVLTRCGGNATTITAPEQARAGWCCAPTMQEVQPETDCGFSGHDADLIGQASFEPCYCWGIVRPAPGTVNGECIQ